MYDNNKDIYKRATYPPEGAQGTYNELHNILRYNYAYITLYMVKKMLLIKVGHKISFQTGLEMVY